MSSLSSLHDKGVSSTRHGFRRALSRMSTFQGTSTRIGGTLDFLSHSGPRREGLTSHDVNIIMIDVRSGMVDVDWDHLYILGWTRRDGSRALTSWDGDQPMVDAVMVGSDDADVPVWRAAVPEGAELHPIPKGRDPDEYAAELGGIRVFGWLVDEGIERIDYQAMSPGDRIRASFTLGRWPPRGPAF